MLLLTIKQIFQFFTFTKLRFERGYFIIYGIVGLICGAL